MHSLRLAHISDLHISAEHRRINVRNTRRVLEYIASLNVDHLVITGDVTADATSGDFTLARHILASHGMLHTSKLTLVIGNHDIFGGVHHAEDILTFPRRCREVKYNTAVRLFHSHFPEAFEKCLFSSGGEIFPFVKALGDVMLVGVNSVARYSRMKNPLGSNGAVDDEAYERLEMMLSSDLLRKKRKVVIIHHHFNKMTSTAPSTMHSVWGAIERQMMKLRGKKSLLNLFRRHNVDIVLHGHVHETREYERKGIRFLNGGGSIVDRTGEHLHVNIVSISTGGVTTEIHKIPVRESAIPIAPPLHIYEDEQVAA